MPAALITSVGQDRLILTRSGSGDPELQGWEGYALLWGVLPLPDACRYSLALQGGMHTETAL